MAVSFPSDLKCDFDGAMPVDFEQRLRFICGLMRWRVEWYWVRRTRHGWHAGVRLTRRITPWKAIAAQACLGSDFRREVYNMGKWRVRHPAHSLEAQFWNVLFTDKFTQETTDVEARSEGGRRQRRRARPGQRVPGRKRR